VIQLNDLHFLYLRRSGLIIGVTTKYNASPSTILGKLLIGFHFYYQIELLNQITRVIKDYCGVLNEESIRRNFILVYELLDEMLDMG